MSINKTSAAIEQAFLMSDEEMVEKGLMDDDDMFRTVEPLKGESHDCKLEEKGYCSCVEGKDDVDKD